MKTPRSLLASALPGAIRAPFRPDPVTTPEQLLKARDVVTQVYLDDRIKQYIVNLVFATRDPASVGAGALDGSVQEGQGKLGGACHVGGGSAAPVADVLDACAAALRVEEEARVALVALLATLRHWAHPRLRRPLPLPSASCHVPTGL